MPAHVLLLLSSVSGCGASSIFAETLTGSGLIRTCDGRNCWPDFTSRSPVTSVTQSEFASHVACQ
jgi:hypothetical protein